MEKVIIRVPASTSNLGPGFDCLGVALRLYNFVTVARVQDRQRSRREPSDVDGKAREGWRAGRRVNQSHSKMVNVAARLFFKRARVRPFSFSCRISGDVPASRGLGGSATVRLGALHALNRIAGSPLDRLSILQLGAELEKHPDNAAPATLGGFTVVRGENVQRFEVSSRLYFVLLIPDFEIETSRARKVLPAKMSRQNAVESCANACAITAAFASRNYENLRGALVDHLHQPFRQKLIPFLPRVITAAESAGALGAFLSGSGSTIAALTLDSPKKVAVAMQRAARSTSTRTIITKADNDGVQFKSQTKRSDGSLD